jgi:NADH-quinone oxidoreductase subunit N
MEIKIFLTEIFVFSGIFLSLLFFIFSKRIFYIYFISIVSHLISIFSEFCLLKNKISGEIYFLKFSPEREILSIILIFSSLISIFLFLDYYKREIIKREIPFLILNSLFSLLILIKSNNLFISFVAIEYLSIVIYSMIISFKESHFAIEALLKYFILSSFSSLLILFSLSIIYLNSSNLNYSFLKEKEIYPLHLLGIIFLFAGLSFKLLFVPFHLWTPDIFEALPFPFISFIGVVPKIGMFGFLYFLYENLNFDILYIGIISIITMFVGNISALFEKKLKRIFAFSTVAHSGYILLPFLSKSKVLFDALTFYLTIYAIMQSGIFLLLQNLKDENVRIDDLKNKTSLSFSFFSLIFLLSLTGIPPTGGFYGKFYIFSICISEGYTFYVLIAFLNSVISAYYYLRIAGEIFKGKEKIKISILSNILTILLISLIILFGIYPELINFIK